MIKLTAKRFRGVTLIELMVVVAIVGILAAVGYPSYISYIQKSRRGDCTDALTEVQQMLERCRAVYTAYNDPDCGVAFPFESQEGYYQVILDARTANSYRLTCVPQGSQTSDDLCASISVNEADNRTARDVNGNVTDGACW